MQSCLLCMNWLRFFFLDKLAFIKHTYYIGYYIYIYIYISIIKNTLYIYLYIYIYAMI